MPKVMVLEDEAVLYELLQDLLGFEGYEVIRPEKFEQTLDEVQRLRPEAVLIDVHLKDINGLDLLDQIRSDSHLKDCYVVVTSGMDYAREAKQRGADDFIMKPYMPDDLLQKLSQRIKQ